MNDELNIPTQPPRPGRRSFVARTAAVLGALTLGRQLALAQGTASSAKWVSGMELAVNFSLLNGSGGRYERPYVAVWIEDANGQPVRTLGLWINTSGRGQRYVRELRRWVSAESDAAGDLLGTVSSPTRNPGQYSLSWDGKTDARKDAPQGNYLVNIEYAREHGPYDLLRAPVTIGAKPFKKALEGATEVGGASVEYRKRA